MNAPSLHAISVISYKEKKATPVSVNWNNSAPLQQMTLTLLYALQSNSSQNNSDNPQENWLSIWSEKVQDTLDNYNIQQDNIQAMHKWHQIQKNSSIAPQKSLLHNPQSNITNFLDYASLCVKFICHQKNKNIAVRLLHLIILHTHPGTDNENIHKYYEIKNTLYHMQNHTCTTKNYKDTLLNQELSYPKKSFVSSNSLIYMTMGFMIGSLSETLSIVSPLCF